MKKPISALLLVALLAGCAADRKPMPEPILTPLNNIEPEPVNNPGSLFESGQSEFLFDDNRATRVGDIVMVTVSEITTGKHKADTTATKDSSNAYAITAMPKTGIYGTLGKVVPGVTNNGAPGVGTTSVSNLKSTGETKQESTLTATVATRVIRMLPGKVMQVEGARQIRINDETQILVVRGLVRQRDIDSKTPCRPRPWPMPASRSTARVRFPTSSAPAGCPGSSTMSGPSSARVQEVIMLRAAHIRTRMGERLRTLGVILLCLTVLVLAGIAPAHAVRLKDIASFSGVRTNELVGYGLVVGLSGTPDFGTAMQVVNRINASVSGVHAKAVDASTIQMAIPQKFQNNIVPLMASLENLDISPDSKARVVVDEKTGTVVLGGNVRLTKVAVAHGNLQIVVSETPNVSQPGPFSQGTTAVTPQTNVKVKEQNNRLLLMEGATLQELVDGLNSVGATPRDLISILRTLKTAGSLHADLEVI